MRWKSNYIPSTALEKYFVDFQRSVRQKNEGKKYLILEVPGECADRCGCLIDLRERNAGGFDLFFCSVSSQWSGPLIGDLTTMPSSSKPDPIELNMSDVLANCDGHARDLALALLERGGNVTLGEIADITGVPADELVRQIFGGVIAGAAIQLLNAER